MALPTHSAAVFAEPRLVTDARDCHFYHTVDIPGLGVIEGEWDLRHGIDAYLGNVDVRGKRVLDVGAASGFISFHLERQGAEVISYDLGDRHDWDVVPFARANHAAFGEERRRHLRRLNNGYWFCHRAFTSRARMVYGDVYAIPAEIGEVDLAVFGSILLHLRDPSLALENALRLTRETVVITDRAANGARWRQRMRRLGRYGRLLPELLVGSPLTFLPDWRSGQPIESWWQLTPGIVQNFVGILGFEDSRVTYHRQTYHGYSDDGRRRTELVPQFTVVARRTVPLLR